MTSSTSLRRRCVAAVAALIMPAAAVTARAQARGAQPAPPPRSAQNDSGRTRRLATDTTRNRRAANQDTTRAPRTGADSADARAGLNGIRLRSIGPGMVSGRISDIAVHPRDNEIWYVGGRRGRRVEDDERRHDLDAGVRQRGVLLDRQRRDRPEEPERRLGRHRREQRAARAWPTATACTSPSTAGGRGRTSGCKRVGAHRQDRRSTRATRTSCTSRRRARCGDGRRPRAVQDDRRRADVEEGARRRRGHRRDATSCIDPRNPDVLRRDDVAAPPHVWRSIDGGPESAMYRIDRRRQDVEEDHRRVCRPDELGRIGLAISPANPDVVYAIVEAARRQGGFYRSTRRRRDVGEAEQLQQRRRMYYGDLVRRPGQRRPRLRRWTCCIQVSDDGGQHAAARSASATSTSTTTRIWIDPDDADHLSSATTAACTSRFDRGQNWHVLRQPADHAVLRRRRRQQRRRSTTSTAARRTTTRSAARRARAASHGIMNADWFVDRRAATASCRKVDPKDPNIVYAESQHGVLHALRPAHRRARQHRSRSPSRASRRCAGTGTRRSSSPRTRTRGCTSPRSALYRSDDRGDTWKASAPTSRGSSTATARR